MTINLADNSPRISYSVAQGVTQTSFAVPFEFFDNGDLNVYIDGTLKTITTHYTVTGGDGSTGTVSMSVTGGTGGSTVVITRDIALERTTDFPVSGAFNIVALNTELDRLVAVAADLDDLAGRGVKLSDFDTAATLTLPLAADRVNKVLAFNSAGDTLLSQELGVWKGDWAASTAYVERDLVRDSSDGSIYIVTSAHTSSGSTPLDTNTNSSKYSVIFDIGAMIAGTVTMTGDLSVQGNTTLGNAATDTVTITADVASNILPSADNTYDLGGTGAEWKDVYIDGVAYVDSIAMPTTTVTDILDEDTMSSNSATALATQQSIKAYVDSQIGSNNELSEVLGNGNTTGGNNIQLTTTDELQFRDTALKISSSADGQLDIDADTEVEITAPTVDINASTEVNISGDFTVDTNTLHVDSTNNRVGIANLSPSTALDVTGTVTATGGAFTGNVIFGDNNKAIFGTSSNLEIYGNGGYSYIDEVGANNLNIRTNGANIGIYDTANSQYMAQFTTGGGVELYHNGAQKFTTTPAGIDIGGTVLATGGAFTGDVTFGDNDKAIFGAGSDLQIYHDGSHSYISDQGTGNLRILAQEFNVKSASGTTDLIYGVNGGSLYLYHNGNSKLSTTSTGIDVTGTITTDILDVSGTNQTPVNIIRDEDGSSVGPIVRLYKNATSPSANDFLGSIDFKGNDDGGNEFFYSRINGKVVDPVNGSETGAIEFRVADNGSAAFNNSRIVGTMTNNGLGLGIDTPAAKLHARVDGNNNRTWTPANATTALFERNSVNYVTIEANSANNAALTFADESSQTVGSIQYNHPSDAMVFNTNSAERLRIDSSGNVGVGTASPQAQVHLQGSGSSSGRLRLNNTNTANYSVLEFRGDSQSFDVGLGNSAATATLQNKFYIYDSTNTTTRLVLDSSGQVGIGTTSPSGLFHAKDSSSSFMFKDVSGNAKIFLDGSNGDFAGGDYMEIEVDSSPNLMFKQAGTERLRIDSSGRLLVGKTSNSNSTAGTTLYGNGKIEGVRDGGSVHQMNRLTSDGDILDFQKDGTSVGSIGTVSGDLWIGSSAASHAAVRFANGTMFPVSNTGGSSDGLVDIGDSLARFKDLYLSGGLRGDTTFKNNAGTTEYARFDSSGRLLIGTTTANTTGITLHEDGEIYAVRDGDNVAIFDRSTSDGNILTFRKDGTTVGNIRAEGSGTGFTLKAAASNGYVAFHANNQSTGIFFEDATTKRLAPYSSRDDEFDLGGSSRRWDDVYATNGTIQTSDRNEKQDIAELSDAEQRVAVAAKGLLRKFRWKTAAAKKGDEARTHFGIIAQDLQAAFAAEGLDASDYAMFISTTWTDEETGEERTRMGVRYSELLAFIIAAI